MASRKYNRIATPQTETHNLSIGSFNFQITVPQPSESRETTDDKFVHYSGSGYANTYPDFLLKLYNESATHGAIINQKANFIVGDGLRPKGTKKVLDLNVSSSDTLDEFVNKVALDFLIFNMFFVEVIKNKLGQPIQYHHVPAFKIRTNRSKTRFWYNDSWAGDYGGRKSIVYERFVPGRNTTTSEIFMYDGYTPSTNLVYPAPEYKSVHSIMADIAIAQFDLNNLKNHFSPSTVVTFFNGSNVTEQQRREAFETIKSTYTGENGGKVIIDFQSPEGKAADVKNISAGDWDKAYIATADKIEDRIFKGHQVVSPSLFGQKQAGQLGGSQELETAYEIFKNTYVQNKRNQIQSGLNTLFADSQLVTDRVEFADRTLFSVKATETLKEKIMTINELRAENDLEPIQGGDIFISETLNQGADVAKAKNGLTETNNFSKQLIELSEEDFDRVSGLGQSFGEDYEFSEIEDVFSKQHAETIALRFDDQKDIADYIIENKIETVDLNELKRSIRRELGIAISTDGLSGMLNELTKAGLLNVTVADGRVEVKAPEQRKSVEVMYGYRTRDGLGPDKIRDTRPFCRRMIDGDRYYTRQEIQTMSSIFEYDIFRYGGGFYRNPDNGEITPHCRHYWKAFRVSRK